MPKPMILSLKIQHSSLCARTAMLVSILVTWCVPACSPDMHPPAAVNAFLDVSSRDFTARGPVKLDGQWEFYWNRLISPAEFKEAFGDADRHAIHVPGTWDILAVNGVSLPGHGYATYRLKVKLPAAGVRYGLKLKESGTAYRLWVDGVPIASNGTVGADRSRSIPQFLPGVFFFTPASRDIEITIQVSNFHDKKGGIWHSILLGLDSQITSIREWAIMVDSMLFGILFIMAVYHLGLYILRRRDRSALYFCAYCAIIALRTLLMGERLLISFMPDFNWELELKLEHMTFYLGVPFFALFFRSLYRDEVNRNVVRVIAAAGAAFTAVLAATPARIHTHLVTPFQFVTIFAILYCCYALSRAIINRRQGAWLILAGFLFISSTVINDFLYDHGLVNTGYMLSWGLLVFIFFQSFVISMRFSGAFSRAETLSGELMASKKQIEDYNISLEQKVWQRTEKIIEQKIFLEQQIAMAEKLQRTLLPDRIPAAGRINIAHLYVPMMGVGGDLFDFRQRGEESLGIFICDVSGHGVAGAILASMVKMSLNSWDAHLERPAQALGEIHGLLKDKLGSNFISACACFIDLNTGVMRSSNAGHPSIIIIRKDGEMSQVNTRGHVMADLFSSRFEEAETILRDGDRIVLYTDGITEARDSTGELYGESRFMDLLDGLRDRTPRQMCDGVFDAVKSFCANSEGMEDDITLIVMEY